MRAFGLRGRWYVPAELHASIDAVLWHASHGEPFAIRELPWAAGAERLLDAQRRRLAYRRQRRAWAK